MFNKIIVSVVSSIVMFACNVKDSTDGDVTSSADVVSSVSAPAPEAVKTHDDPSTPVVSPTPQVVNPSPVVNPTTSTDGASAGATPLVAPVAPSTVVSPVVAPTVSAQPATAQPTAGVVAPSTVK